MGHGGERLGRHAVDDVLVVCLGDHERMDGGLGVQIVERDDEVVLVHNGG